MVQGYNEEKDASDHAGWLQMGRIANESKKTKDFNKMWQTEKRRVAKSLSDDYALKLMEIYEKIPHKKISSSPIEFVNDIAWRIYSEWAMGEGKGSDPGKYSGEAFNRFIDEETGYAMKRAQEKGLTQTPITHGTYLEIREKVLEGLAKKAVELFSCWDGNTHPIEPNDNKNLRVSLETYIGF